MGITVLGTGRGWVGSAQWIWGVAETSEMLGRFFLFRPQKDRAYMERRVVGTVGHGMALGEELLSRLVLRLLERKTPGAGD